MRINYNIAAISTSRILGEKSKGIASELEKLSSGLRINKAGDDAAGLCISEKMRAQIRGLDQASRNIQDAISLVQTAEGAMSEVHALLQRGRELSVQAANGTNSPEEENAIQAEISQIRDAIDGIAENTEFNTKKLLNASSLDGTVKNAVIDGLKSGWLEEAAKLIKNYYGLDAGSENLTIVLDPTTGAGTLAYVASSWIITGDDSTLTELSLHIDLGDFAPAAGESGNNGGPVCDDRIVAHEMVHAVMASAMGDDFRDMPNWFKEGTAEFLPGADERLWTDAFIYGLSNVVDRAAELVNGASWVGSSFDYSAAYLAVKYIQTNLDGGKAFKDVISDINDDIGSTDNTIPAIIANTVFTDQADLVNSIRVNGANFYSNVIHTNDSDTGSIMGSDHGGTSLNADDVIPTGTPTENPTNFNIIFPDKEAVPLIIQVGANEGQTLKISVFDVRPSALAIEGIDVSVDASGAITAFDNAIGIVSTYRSSFGAMQNRLEHAMQVSQNASENLQRSESQIRDVDMAKSMMEYTKMNILSQTAQAMLAQANQLPQSTLKLLTA